MKTTKNSASKNATDTSITKSLISKVYLFSYNFIQTIGWSYLLYQLIIYYAVNKGSISLYDTVACTVITFQNAAVLEILHAFLKIVPSNPVLTTQQVFSRVMVVCGVLMPTVAGRNSAGLPFALVAWSFAEIIRYSYYAINQLGAAPYFIVWLRYTSFIILYPIGITGELLCLYAAQEEVGETGMWSTSFPNKLNFIFNYQHFIIFVMLLYIPLFPQLYLHMFTQRKKVLGGTTAAGTSKKVK